MKSIFVVLILAGVAFAWYAIPVPAAKHHRAAAGTYFLREYHSLRTDAGLVGWTPGQELHEVTRAPLVSACRTVTDGALVDLLPESLLTQDIEDAEAMRLADRADEDRTRNHIAAAAARIDANKLREQITTADDVSRNNAAMVAASTVGTYASRLNEPRTIVRSGSGGYVGYPVYVEGGSAPAVATAPSSIPSGVTAGTAAARQSQSAMSASSQQRATEANARAAGASPRAFR